LLKMEEHKHKPHEHKPHEHKPHEHKPHEHKTTGNSNPNMKLLIMAIALALLIVISGVQAAQLVGLKNKLNVDLKEIAASGSKSTVSTGGSSNTLNNNLDNLPSMVGGC
tara:strand:- start:155 stop:481 length:327 start_codon:yes stop_codon:yes gene_type:complete